jgi:hypothetical protein
MIEEFARPWSLMPGPATSSCSWQNRPPNCCLTGDRQAIFGALINLLENALQASTPAGG